MEIKSGKILIKCPAIHPVEISLLTYNRKEEEQSFLHYGTLIIIRMKLSKAFHWIPPSYPSSSYKTEENVTHFMKA